MKYNNTGQLLKNETYDSMCNEGGEAIVYDRVNNVLYIVGGRSIGSFPYFNSNVTLLKINTTLHKIWEKNIEFAWNEKGEGICVDSQGNVYITGDLDDIHNEISDVYIAKYSPAEK